MTYKKPTAIDLFCGAGGFSLGFEQAGFNVIGAIDIDPIHIDTYSSNFAHSKTICADISTLSGKDILKKFSVDAVDVLFGGPPCQGFSLIGRRSCDDPRNKLLFEFARFIKEIKPQYFVLENVEGLLSGHAINFLNRFIEEVEKDEYIVVKPIQVLNASDFGVPQKRKRVFVIGYKINLPAPKYPDQNQMEGNTPSVWDAIGDLQVLEQDKDLFDKDVFTGKLGTPSNYASMLREKTSTTSTENKYSEYLTGCKRSFHTPNITKRFEKTKPGTIEPVSRFYRLDKEGLSCTLRAGSDKTRGSFTAPRPIHPIYPRCITVREAARLHSYPDWFTFNSTIWHGFRQIGNSVPPILARKVAETILKEIIVR